MNNISSELKSVITQMKKPLRGLSFGLVIESLSNYKVIKFDKENEQDINVLEILQKVANNTMSLVNKKGIIRSRPNEVGNDIESYVKDSLNSFNFQAFTPKTDNGHRKSTGYPDIEFIDKFKRNHTW